MPIKEELEFKVQVVAKKVRDTVIVIAKIENLKNKNRPNIPFIRYKISIKFIKIK